MSELELADSIIRHALELQRLSASEEAEALAIMRELEQELRQLLATTELADAKRREVEALIRDANRAIAAKYGEIPGLLDTERLMMTVADRTVSTLESVMIASAPSAARIASLAKDVLIDGAPSSAWWARQGETLAWKFAAEVRQGVLLDETQEQIVSRIVGRGDEIGIMDKARRDVRALVHSSVMTAANRARLETYRKNGRRIAGIRWLATLDGHTCMTCMALDGSKWDLDGKPLGDTDLDFQVPPAHFSCFPGDALVLPGGDVTGASKRWFKGELVVIKTAADREFSCTPNHPILTDQGWVAAGLLDVGCNVVGYLACQREGAVDGNRENIPARIHDVAEALLGSLGVRSIPVPLTAKDFHGDGRCGDVAVVGSDRFLRRAFNTALAQPFDEPLLVAGGPAGLVSLAGERCPAHFVEGSYPTPACTVSGSDLPFSFLWGHASPLESLSLAMPALGDAVLAQDSRNHDAFQAELLGDRILGNTAGIGGANSALVDYGCGPDWYLALVQMAEQDAVRDSSLAADLSTIEPGLVELDRVIDKRLVDFAGHVYNLETTVGWYVADSVIAHNCRCVASPIPKGIDEIFGTTGLDARMSDGPRATAQGPQQVAGFGDFLSRQSPEFVEEMLGARRAELWQAGDLTLRDLVSGSGRPLTLDELTTR